MRAMLVDEALIAEIVRIGEVRKPAEACGVLLPVPDSRGNHVIELPNRSMNAQSSFEIWPDDIEQVLHDWVESVHPSYLDKIAVWHTHPRGGVGPSRGDMQNKIDGVPYLVVALRTEGPVPLWF